MLNKLIQNIINEMKKKYPHIETPAATRAIIKSAKKIDKKYEEEVTLVGDTGEQKEYIARYQYYQYAVQPVDNQGNVLDNYPGIPNVISRQKYEVGNMVSIVFTGGEIYPVIVGE